MIKRCPKCKRFGIQYDPNIEKEMCVWRNCGWVNNDNIDLDKYDYGVNFKKFRDSIKVKTEIPV